VEDENCSGGVCEIKRDKPLERLSQIRSRINALTVQHGRPADSCILLPVTKTVPIDVLKELCRAGRQIFGENKVQELKLKRQSLNSDQVGWHFIGYLQTNKVKECIKDVELLHSLDRLNLAISLDKALQKENRVLDVLVQVNTSGESSKFGVHPDDAMELVRKLARFDTIKIKGLMTLARFSDDKDIVRTCFRKLKSLSDILRNESIAGVEMNELSMGMSSDFEIAIEEGSTIVRVGEAIFGKRSLPHTYYWNEETP